MEFTIVIWTQSRSTMNIFIKSKRKGIIKITWAVAIFTGPSVPHGASQVALVVKHPPANAGDIRDMGSIPGLGRSPGGRYDNPLQYSCLENSMDRGTWQATVHRVIQSRTLLK